MPDGWRMVTADGLSVLVPEQLEGGRPPRLVCWGRGRRNSRWSSCPARSAMSSPADHPVESLGITIGSASAASLVYESGHVWRYEQGTGPDGVEWYLDGSWLGYWYDDDRLVSVNAADRETVERILDSVDTEWTTAEHDGVTVDLPPGWVAKDQTGCEWEFAELRARRPRTRATPTPRASRSTPRPPSTPPTGRGCAGARTAGRATSTPATTRSTCTSRDEQVGQRILDSREPAR